MDPLPVFLSHRSPLFTREKSLFFRQGDSWIVGYRRTVAFLKTTRGLQDLALLLRNPGREFHVSGRPPVLGELRQPAAEVGGCGPATAGLTHLRWHLLRNRLAEVSKNLLEARTDAVPAAWEDPGQLGGRTKSD